MNIRSVTRTIHGRIEACRASEGRASQILRLRVRLQVFLQATWPIPGMRRML